MMKRTHPRWIAVVVTLTLCVSLGALQAADTQKTPATEFAFTGEETADAPNLFEFRFVNEPRLVIVRGFFRLASRLTGTWTPLFSVPRFNSRFHEPVRSYRMSTLGNPNQDRDLGIIDDDSPM
jgi:hypothetical protein